MLDVGAYFISMFQTSTKGFIKCAIYKLENYWPEGSYFMLKSKPVVPGGGFILSIGYEYIYGKFLYFIATEREGRKKYGIPYLSKYPDKLASADVQSVVCPQIMSKFFVSVNKIDSHKKSWKSDLDLEKQWIT